MTAEAMKDTKPACVIDGVPWYDFSFEYDWDGGQYGFQICARSEQEARERLKRLPLARYVGIGYRVEPRPWTIFTLPLLVWWMNFKNSKSRR